MTTGVVALLVIVAVVLASIPLFRWVADRRDAADRSLPPIFFPMSSGDSSDSRATAAPQLTATAVDIVAPVAPPPPKMQRRAPVMLEDLDEDKPAPAETVRFLRRGDEPVQLLPGRLEVLAGETRHHEIRFVRLPGKADQLILGRDAGPSPQYVGLGSTTVSRRHARFAFTDGCWTIENLSQTNPVVVNDDELSDIDGERPLVDGDRLELGEIVLRFHAR